MIRKPHRTLIGITSVSATSEMSRASVPVRVRGASRNPTGPIIFAAVLGALLVLSFVGLPYYIQGLGARVRSPLHAWFRPSGTIGQSLGILAFAAFLFLWIYPIRKRVRALARLGALPGWLRVHTLVGFFLPWIVALHAAWRFTGLAGLAFWAMLVVWASGVVGRYLYRRIPRNQQGVEMTLDQVASRRRELLLEISTYSGFSPEQIERATMGRLAPTANPGFLRTWRRFLTDDWVRRRTVRDLKRLTLQAGGADPDDDETWNRIFDLTKQQVALEQQARLLEATRRIFHHWHAAHLPVGVTALIAVIIHVVVVIAVGATWFH
jgi:hypothetical protein